MRKDNEIDEIIKGNREYERLMRLEMEANTALIDAVRAMHNKLYAGAMYHRYRELLDATPEKNTQGAVWIDEFCALQIMQEVATVEGVAVIAMQKLAHLGYALDAVLLSDGLGGSLEAAQRHVATVKEEHEEGERECIEARLAFRRAHPDLPRRDPSKMN
jgi:hypothetical protein